MTEIEKIINEELYNMYAYGEAGVSANRTDKIVSDCLAKVKKLIIHDISVSFEDGYKKGYKESTSEACKEIAKNYTPNER